MNWDEFYERYVNGHEEFCLKWRNFIIELLYAPNGQRFAYYVSTEWRDNNKGTLWNFFRLIKHWKKDKPLSQGLFDSPEELLNHFRLEGKTLIELWPEMDWN